MAIQKKVTKKPARGKDLQEPIVLNVEERRALVDALVLDAIRKSSRRNQQ